MVDFARDVDEVTDILRQGGCKVGKYTGHIKVDDRKLADTCKHQHRHYLRNPNTLTFPQYHQSKCMDYRLQLLFRV